MREFAALALAEINDPRGVPALIEKFREEESFQVRSYIAHALGKMKDSRAIDPLMLAVAGLDRRGYRMEREAIEPRMAIGAPVVSRLVERLNDPQYVNDDRMIIAVCRVLGRFRDSATIPLLFDVYDRGDEDVRYTADWALDQMDRQAVEAWERRRLVSRVSSRAAVGVALLGIGYLAWRTRRQRTRKRERGL